MYEGSNVQLINLVLGGQGLSALCFLPLCRKEVNVSKDGNWKKKNPRTKGQKGREGRSEFK